MKKLIFFSIWTVLIIISVVTLFRVTPLSFALSNSTRLTSFMERGLGLIAFNLLFVQIILGAFMEKFSKKFGNWIFNFHAAEGILVYLFVFIHVFTYVLLNYFSGHGLDPYVAFINICLLCKTPYDYYLTAGRISFWILSVGVLAAILRKFSPWFINHWRKFHVVNYFVFILMAVHGFMMGSDFRTMPFFALAITETTTVFVVLAFNKIPQFYKFFRGWISS
jgi:predicted ferric reductase